MVQRHRHALTHRRRWRWRWWCEGLKVEVQVRVEVGTRVGLTVRMKVGTTGRSSSSSSSNKRKHRPRSKHHHTSLTEWACGTWRRSPPCQGAQVAILSLVGNCVRWQWYSPMQPVPTTTLSSKCALVFAAQPAYSHGAAADRHRRVRGGGSCPRV